MTDDKRSKRPPLNYVLQLQTQISQLESVIERVRRALPEEREVLLKDIDLTKNDLLNLANGSHPLTTTRSSSSTTSKVKLLPDNASSMAGSGKGTGSGTGTGPGTVPGAGSTPESNLQSKTKTRAKSVYGPTSIYNNDIITNPSRRVKHDESTIKTLNKDPDILHCLKTFFTWQYPDHNMFIFREAFLIDFFDPKPHSLYCSKPLVFAVCALGARMSDNEAIYQRSHQFYIEARSLLLLRLDHPSIPSLQSFLLLAFYDICNGQNLSGWMLSGNAFRMGYDLGFQLNPHLWFVKYTHEDVAPLDVAIRSRIYWGSYMADHFISLLLGRPSLLKMSEATIPETDYLPDLEWIDEYIYQDPNPTNELKNILLPLKSVINLINISDSMLTTIFTRSDADDDSHDDLNFSSRLQMLSSYNSKIMQWKKDLPLDLAWDGERLDQTAASPVLGCVRNYYYILVLCLNRPFVGVAAANEDTTQPLPSEICSDAIEEIYRSTRRFQQVHGLRKASIFIVYCTILSISVLLLTNNSKQLVDDKKEKLNFFMEVLKGCSKTWGLAEKSYLLINIKLKSIRKLEMVDVKVETTDNEFTNWNIPHSETANGGLLNRTHMPNGMASGLPPTTTTSTTTTTAATAPNTANIRMASPPVTGRSGPIPTAHTDNSASPRRDRRTSIAHLHDLARQMESPKIVLQENESVPMDTPQTSLGFEIDENLDFFGGPPVLMTSDLSNEDWESLFPDYIFNVHN